MNPEMILENSDEWFCKHIVEIDCAELYSHVIWEYLTRTQYPWSGQSYLNVINLIY